MKWRLVGKDEETDLGLSVYPQLSFDVSSSSVDRGLTERTFDLFVPVEIAFPVGICHLAAEVGWSFRRYDHDEWVARAAIAVLSDRFEGLFELAADGAVTSSESLELSPRLGFRWEMAPEIRLLGACGPVFGPGDAEFRAFIGVRFDS